MSYESEVLRDWFLLFHFGTGREILGGSAFSQNDIPRGCLDFPKATVDAFQLDPDCNDESLRALDVGCAVGRSAFELSRIAGQVIGIDFSESFIATANELKETGKCRFRIFDEAHLSREIETKIPDGVCPAKVFFEQGDAMNLREDLGSFDLVHAANLICRLPGPRRFLDRLPELVKPGGKLVLATPATWMPDYTPPENFPKGATLDFLKEQLSESFELVAAEELPFLIREHRRKFQLSSSETSLWIRKR